jgi:hypothetical protein
VLHGRDRALRGPGVNPVLVVLIALSIIILATYLRM